MDTQLFAFYDKNNNIHHFTRVLFCKSDMRGRFWGVI